MKTLLRALAKLVLANVPTADKPPSNIASMVMQCKAKDRPDLGEKILVQWIKVLEKYPQTRVNWATACALGGNSIKKNVFGGMEFIDWLAEALGTKPEGKNIPAVEIPKGTPAIAIPTKDETPEDWQSAAEETAHMLKNAEKAFASVGEFIKYLEKEIGELKRKLGEYGPGGDKHTLKSGKPHSFVSKLPKWTAQLEAYEAKLAGVNKSIAETSSKFQKTVKDYDNAKVTTVAFESKVQDSLVDVLAFILDIQDLKKQKVLLDKFQENLKKLESEKSAASVLADAGDFLGGLWEKVVGFWDAVFSWVSKLTKSVDSFSSIVHIADKAGAEAAWAPKEDGIKIDHNMIEVKGPGGQLSVLRFEDCYIHRGKKYSFEEVAKKLANKTELPISEIKKALKKAKAVKGSVFENIDIFEIAEALNYWLQHNWEGQGDELYKAYCELTDPKVFKLSPLSKFEKMSGEAKHVYDSLTRSNYKEALDAVLNFDRDDYAEKLDASVAAYESSMTCEDFFECDSDEFYTYIDEMHLGDNYSADKLFEFMKKNAEKAKVALTDKDTFDYDDFFWDAYQAAEKGLS